VHVEHVPAPRTPYHFPLVSSGTLFGELPSAVQNTVRAQAGMAEVTGVIKDTSHADAIYRVHFRSEIYPPLVVARDGAVLNPDLTVAIPAPPEGSGGRLANVKLNELPPDVVKALHEREPDAEVATIERETWGSRAVYIFNFRNDKQHPKLYLRADGVILNDTQR